MRKSLLHTATKIALEKFPNHPEFGNFIHYSFVVLDNKILGYGENNAQTPPIHYGYGKRLINCDFKPKTHSEICAYKRTRGLLKNRPFEMINIRLGRGGDLKNSKPCECCDELLTVLGCKKIYYSTDNGFVQKII